MATTVYPWYQTPWVSIWERQSNITVYVDSGFGDCVEDRRSTAGMIQYLGYSPIQWESFVANTTVPLSVAEAEYEAGKMTKLEYPFYAPIIV